MDQLSQEQIVDNFVDAIQLDRQMQLDLDKVDPPNSKTLDGIIKFAQSKGYDITDEAYLRDRMGSEAMMLGAMTSGTGMLYVMRTLAPKASKVYWDMQDKNPYMRYTNRIALYFDYHKFIFEGYYEKFY